MNLLSLKVIRITLMFSLPILAACGGGGGSAPAADPAPTKTFPTLSFQPLVGPGNGATVTEIYNQDLNGDGIDEVIIAGRKTVSAAIDWQNYNVQIFGWNNSSTFTNETANWFSGSDNVIIGTDQNVKFGDFDGDGRLDMILGASTDTGHTQAQTLVFYQNTSGAFTRTVVTNTAYQLWTHDLIIHDFNNDGRMDFLAADYGEHTIMGFGNADDTFTLHESGNGSHGASGIAVADFITSNGNQYGQSSVEIVMSDSGTNSGDTADTTLFTWSLSSGDPAVAGTLTLTSTGTFAADTNTTSPNDHTVRVLAFDYDGDSDMDVIAFSRSLGQDGTSVIDFLANDGAGNFTKDTGATNYTGGANLGVNYQPQLISIDGAGGSDIFLSGASYNDANNATRILVNNDDGTFTDTYSTNFTANSEVKEATVRSLIGSGNPQQIVLGPSNNYYIVTYMVYTADDTFDGTALFGVFTTNIGTNISTGLSSL